MDDTCVATAAAITTLRDDLLEWLFEYALPLWSEHGIDRDQGGFFETLHATAGSPAPVAAGPVRRGRVVARQIYVFDAARRLGWQFEGHCPIEHGCDYLFSRLHSGDGRFHTAIDGAAFEPCAPFDLYEQAFYLFTLARVHARLGDRYPIRETALSCLGLLRRELGKDVGGFEEAVPPRLPLRSNPHMHLLEAALAWIESSQAIAREPWIALARELVGLCLTRFIGEGCSGVRECFAYDWSPLPGDAGRVLEPGHQYEWAWLMLRWTTSPYCTSDERAACTGAAARLMHLAERWGVDTDRGVAINELWDDMTVKDGSAKLWPQTERLKAWCCRWSLAPTAAERDYATDKVFAAGRGLMGYLRHERRGLWHESQDEDGSFAVGATKASSLYHIVCAIDVLTEVVSP